MIFIQEYKIVFCFSIDITPLIKEICVYGKSKGIIFQIKQVNSIKDLIKIRDTFSYQTLIIQQYINYNKPIDSSLLTSLFNNINIICIFDEKFRYKYNVELFKNKLYNCFFGDDLTHVSLQYFVEIILLGRNSSEAKKYYKLEENSDKLIHSIRKICEIHNNTKNKDDVFVGHVEKLIDNFTDNDIKLILTSVNNDIVKRLIDIPIFYLHFRKINSNFKSNKNSCQIINQNKYNNSRLVQINKVNIGVINMTKGSGSTFFTMNFACALSKYLKVSVIEYPLLESYMYFYLGLNTINEYPNAYKKSPFFNDSNLDDIKNYNNLFYHHPIYRNILWMILNPNNNKNNNIDSLQMLKYMSASNSDNINIIDLGCRIFDDTIMDILDQFNLIIVIIDSFVPNLLINLEYIEKIRELSKKRTVNFMYIVNKYNKGVNKHELIKFLQVRPTAYIPMIESKDIYKAVYDGVIPYDYKNVRFLLNKSFTKIYDECIKLGIINKAYKLKRKRWRID